MNSHFRLPERVRGFHDYFKIKAETEDVLREFGYGFQVETLALPHSQANLDWLPHLQERLENHLRRVAMTSEQARREFLIAPILQEILARVDARIRIEYNVDVSPQLRGTLDYLIQSEQKLLILEAKQSNLTNGLTQLVVEMVAIDQWIDSDEPMLFGAVSIGESWRFATLDRPKKQFVQDLSLYSLPTDLAPLVQILLGILEG
jgi:hypothetical protein